MNKPIEKILNSKYDQPLTFASLILNQVRKEKLGDRITSLHQLVSPFGKVKLVDHFYF